MSEQEELERLATTYREWLAAWNVQFKQGGGLAAERWLRANPEPIEGRVAMRELERRNREQKLAAHQRLRDLTGLPAVDYIRYGIATSNAEAHGWPARHRQPGPVSCACRRAGVYALNSCPDGREIAPGETALAFYEEYRAPYRWVSLPCARLMQAEGRLPGIAFDLDPKIRYGRTAS